MKLGLIIPLTQHLEEEFEKVHQLGFPTCQLNGWDQSLFTDEMATRVLAASQVNQVEISAFWCGWEGPAVWDFIDGPLTLGLVPLAYRHDRLKMLLKGSDFAGQLAVPDLITHVGFIPEDPNNPEYKGLIAPLRYLWQDSGGIWPGIKVITGKRADVNSPEWGISRGRLLPDHVQLQREDCVPFIEERLARSIILVHGGMAQDVGPILEMVTEKYLLRLSREWQARKQGYAIFDQIVQSLKEGDIKRLGALTTRTGTTVSSLSSHWVTNSFTEEVFNHLTKFGDDFYGFLMLGGMSGGGMAYLVNPERRQEIAEEIAAIMATAKIKYQDALPFREGLQRLAFLG